MSKVIELEVLDDELNINKQNSLEERISSKA